MSGNEPLIIELSRISVTCQRTLPMFVCSLFLFSELLDMQDQAATWRQSSRSVQALNDGRR